MGGVGSGRGRHWGARDVVDAYLAIDVRQLQRDGLLVAQRTFDLRWSRGDELTTASIRVRTATNRVILEYLQRSPCNDWESMSYPVQLSWTPCHFGGRRPWFLCPARDCGRRVSILYGGSLFACRACHELTYPSQRESAEYRTIRRAEVIRERLGWTAGILNGVGDKPKGMHWRTFEALQSEHDELLKQICKAPPGGNRTRQAGSGS
jgi:hypothetical protein